MAKHGGIGRRLHDGLAVGLNRLQHADFFYEARQMAGLRVAVFRDEDNEPFFARVGAALDLIGRRDRRLARRLPDLLPGGIFVVAFHSAHWGEYNAILGACKIFYRPGDAPRGVADTALTIVHEAAHARIERCGIAYSEGHRARIERICMGREIAFARRARMPRPRIDALQRQRDGLREEDFSAAALRSARWAAIRRRLGAIRQGSR